MRPRLTRTFLGLVSISVLAASALAWGGHGKSIQFTTKSKEAKQAIHEFVRTIETYQPPARMGEVAQKAVEADPDFAFGHYAVSVAAQQPDVAQAEMDKAQELAVNASEGEREYLRAMKLVRSQTPDLEAALEIFKKLRQEYPEDRMVAMLMGQVYMGQGKRDLAREAFEAAAKLDSSTPRVHAFLGNLQLLDGDYAKARQLFKKALSMAPSDSAPFMPYAGRVFADLYEGRVDSALSNVDAYLEAYQRAPGAQAFPAVFIWNMKARINLENNRAEEALKCYKKGLETVEASSIADDQKQVWRGRYVHGVARTLAKMGRHDQAQAEAAKVAHMIEEGGEDAKQYMDALHYLKGYVFIEAGKYDEAVQHLTQIQQPDDFQKALLGRAYEKLGQTDKEEAVYRQILESGQNTLERALAYPEAKKKLAAGKAVS